MIGGYLAGLLAGKDDLESLALGAAAGAATASTDGTQIARAPEVRQLLPLVVIEATSPG
jgi:fructose-1-phosphate kinase PfkB-like protein